MATTDFINTGRTEKEDLQEQIQASSLKLISTRPLNIRTPLSKGRKEKESLFAMNFDLQKQISNNYKVFLSTKKGELLCKPDFGLAISKVYNKTGISLEDKENIAMEDIQKNTKKFFPMIKLKDFQSSLIPSDIDNEPDRFKIVITYNLDITGIEDIDHVVELSIKRSI